MSERPSDRFGSRSPSGLGLGLQDQLAQRGEQHDVRAILRRGLSFEPAQDGNALLEQGTSAVDLHQCYMRRDPVVKPFSVDAPLLNYASH